MSKARLEKDGGMEGGKGKVSTLRFKINGGDVYFS